MRVLSSIGLLTVVAAIQAQEPIKLTPGMTAPKIEVGGWAKYEAPKATPGRFRVVEFWATWCGPCIQTIPHLTELAKKHKDKVDFVGVSVFERGEGTVDKVKKFVTDFGDKMDYRVAFDTPANTMAETWMNAAEQPGIPTAFIVNDKNEVVWVGHPLSMDKPLEDAISGKLDVAAVKAKFVEEVNGRRVQQKLQGEISSAAKLYRDGKKTEAEAALTAIAGRGKREAGMVTMTRLSLYETGSAESTAAIDKLLAEGGESHLMVAQFAIRLAAPNAPEASKEVAKKIANNVVTNSKNAIALYYAGYIFKGLADKESALKAFDAAAAAAPNDAAVKGDASFLDAIKKEKEALSATATKG